MTAANVCSSWAFEGSWIGAHFHEIDFPHLSSGYTLHLPPGMARQKPSDGKTSFASTKSSRNKVLSEPSYVSYFVGILIRQRKYSCVCWLCKAEVKPLHTTSEVFLSHNGFGQFLSTHDILWIFDMHRYVT